MIEKNDPGNRLCQIQGTLGKDETAFDEARQILLEWAAERTDFDISPMDTSKESFSREATDGTRLQIEQQENLWTLRLSQMDATSHLWTTEATLLREHGKTQLNADVFCAKEGNGSKIKPSLPGFVPLLMNKLGLTDYGERLDGKYRVVSTRYDSPLLPEGIENTGAASLLELINDPHRTRPVIVIALDGRMKNPAKAVIDPELLAETVGPMGHVFVLMGDARSVFSKKMGADWSLNTKEARLYGPDFNPEEDDAARHPRIAQDDLLTWPSNHRKQTFAQHVFEAACGTSIKRTLIDRVPGFAQASRQISVNQAHRQDSDLETRFAALQKAFNTLTDAHKTLSDENKALWAMAQEADVRFEQERNAVLRLQQENSDLVAENGELKKGKIFMVRSKSILDDWRKGRFDILTLPDKHRDIPDWAEQNLSQRLILLPSAVADLENEDKQKNGYAFPGMVCESLLFLAHEFWEKRNEPSPTTLNWYKNRLAQKGVEISPVKVPPINKDGRNDYFVVDLHGKNIQLDWHLKNGDSMNRESCLRVYFTYDKPSRRVLVGHLPYHLDCTIK